MSDDEIWHIGTATSGRYPKGSGDNVPQRHRDFLQTIEKLKQQGLSDKQIYEGMGLTSPQYRSNKSQAIAAQSQQRFDQATKLRDSGMGFTSIGREMGISESTVRSLLNPARQDRNKVLFETADIVRAAVDKDSYIDVGRGVPNHLRISDEKLKAATSLLETEGYVLHRFSQEVPGTGRKLTYKVLTKPGTTYPDMFANVDNIKQILAVSSDGGRTYDLPRSPVSVDSKRVAVRYGDEGGGDADGIIYVRPGVADVSLGKSNYAQVRIAVDDSHYLKGVALYKDDLPPGIDLMFNTPKTNTGNKLDAMKKFEADPNNPFGSTIKPQMDYHDSDGKLRQSPMNLVNQEGDWAGWGKTLSSQMLSKQPPALAEKQLKLTYEKKHQEYDEIMGLTNPTVRKMLLEKFALSTDASAAHLSAVGPKNTANYLIVPMKTLKDTEVYAPQFENGTRVALVRHPHAGIFEIPVLTVNNKGAEGKSTLGAQALDAIGINPKVASQLSGADFDGDTVLVIPNNDGAFKASPPLEGLKGFDTQNRYPGYEGMKPMTERYKQHQMGVVSNLISDMNIRGATNAELAAAVRHSMVVIDAYKHKLNYRQSAIDNQIQALKKKYQPEGGPSTLISRAKNERDLPTFKPRSHADGGPVDKETGKLMYTPTGDSYVKRTVNKDGTVSETTVANTMKVKRMDATDDAHKLSSGRPIETVYANHANQLKSLANTSRKEALRTKGLEWSKAAKETYKAEVSSLDSALNEAYKNQPLERQARLIASSVIRSTKLETPEMGRDESKKAYARALEAARSRTGARKQQVYISDREWEAIQAGAISPTKLKKILENADLTRVRELATPRAKRAVSDAKLARAKAMLASGAHSQADVARMLGLPPSTLNDALGA